MGSKISSSSLALFNGELQVGSNGVGQFAGVVAAHGRDHRIIIHVLAELDVLLKEASDAGDQGVQLRAVFHSERGGFDGGLEVAFFFANGDEFGAFDAFDQNLDIAVGLTQALDNIGNGPGGENLIGTRFVDLGIVLGSQEDLTVRGQRFFKARTLDSRPTTNGVIMCGKMTTSRMGIIGSRRVSDFSFEEIIVREP